MEIVGAGGHVVGNRTLPQAISCVEGGTVDAKLADGFVGRIDIGLIARVIHEGYRDTVELDLVFKGHATIDVVGGRASLHTGGEKHEGVNLAGEAVDLNGSVLDQLRLERGTDGGGSGI